MNRHWSMLMLPLLAALTGGARAEVLESKSAGFVLRETATISAPPARVYAALGEVGRWWNPRHSWSGDARNLTLELRAGGCFCERLPDGGSVQHLVVLHAAPGRLLRLGGALGPLQSEALSGSMSWSLAVAGEKTDLVLDYVVGGYVRGGNTGQTWAQPVDGVLAEQVARLKRYLETGRPEPADR